MKKMKKLVISLLCIMFMVGLNPNIVFAADNNSTEEKIESLKTYSSQYGKMVEVEDGLYIITIPITESSSSVLQSKSALTSNSLKSSSELFAGVSFRS